jgi:hypothetical protein
MFNSVTIWATMPKSMEHLRGGYIGQVPFDPKEPGDPTHDFLGS